MKSDATERKASDLWQSCLILRRRGEICRAWAGLWENGGSSLESVAEQLGRVKNGLLVTGDLLARCLRGVRRFPWVPILQGGFCTNLEGIPVISFGGGRLMSRTRNECADIKMRG